MVLEELGLELKEIPFQQWGPWINHWGYETVVAQFDDVIILKSMTPYDEELLCYFVDWEDCERIIMLIEQDRRF
jgi:hypothetical protein